MTCVISEKTDFYTRILVILGVLTAFWGSGVRAGFYGGNCPPKAQVASNVSVSCQRDCQTVHNALYGFCGEHHDYNCYCSQPLSTPSPVALQCANATNPKYKELCHIDCICNHGALDSMCNYKTKACTCMGQNPHPENNKLCPFKCLRDLIVHVNNFQLPGIRFNAPEKCVIQE